MTERLVAALLVLTTGCGASMNELRANHVWDRALCETELEDAPAVREGIEADEQLAVAVQAVPPEVITALGPSTDGAPNEHNPLDDVVIARVRRAATEIPIESSEMRVRLLVDGHARPRQELDFEDLLRRTEESVPSTRVVRHRRGGGGGSVGPLEFFGRLLAGVVTLGLSELLIRSATSGGSYTTTEEPSPSQIAAAAPYASALSVAYEELSRGGDIHVWGRPPEGSTRALEVLLVHEARCQRWGERATLTERLEIPLESDVPLEQAIERRFGHREHTLAELRVMAGVASPATQRTGTTSTSEGSATTVMPSGRSRNES